MKKQAAEILREGLGIPDCQSVLRLDREVRREGKLLSYDTRYLVSSIDPDHFSAEQFQDVILRHWEVENNLHLQKDRYFEEDKHVLRRPGLGEAWTVLTNMAVSLVRFLHGEERTLREVREQCAADPCIPAKRLGFFP